MRLPWSWLVAVGVWSALVALDLRRNLDLLDRQVVTAATAHGRDVFQMVQAIREWNAVHGGVYLRVSPVVVPNPYLDGPERDGATATGTPLTLVNPASMTRQLSAVLQEHAGPRVHITSLRPVNPDNRADAWESAALSSFETGRAEHCEFDRPGLVVRYMAPLVATASCLSCHAREGYREGEVRGGISVTYSGAPFVDAVAGQRERAIAEHLLGWAALVAVTLLAALRTRYYLTRLEGARSAQEQLVEVRTGQLRAEAAERRRAASQLRHMMESTSGGLVGVDVEGRVIVCNAAAVAIIGGEDPAALTGQPVGPILARCHPRLPDLLRRTLGGEAQAQEAMPFAREGRPPAEVEVRIDPVVEGGHVMGAVIALVDASDRQAWQRAVWHRANFDPLTGLANRSLFVDRFERVLLAGARAGRRVALLFIDLDGFKDVNDRHGHPVGDRVLAEIGGRLAAVLRGTDVAARYGGDEFVVALADVDDEAAVERLATKLMQVVDAPIALDTGAVALSASVGIAVFPDDHAQAAPLVAAADEAMYHAKAAGKRRACFYAGGRFRLIAPPPDAS